MLLHVLVHSLTAGLAIAQVIPHNQLPQGQQATAAVSAVESKYTGSAAYNPLTLNAPPLPEPRPPLEFFLQLESSRNDFPGLSIPQHGAFMGFSIEMSVINQVIGTKPTHIHVPFLNLMAHIRKRAGYVHVRVGGNTQDIASHQDVLPDGLMITKEKFENTASTTETPAVLYTTDMIRMLAQVSELAGVKWYCGIPFNQTTANGGFRLAIAELAEEILGDNLLGFQAGNEPDLYARHGKRQPGYNQYDYFGEFGDLITAIATNDKIPRKNILIGPSIATGDWTAEMVWETGFIDTYRDSLGIVTVEHYPDNNCDEQFGTTFGVPKIPQEMFHHFLNHSSAVELVAPYRASSQLVQDAGKPFMMFETNSGSCGGFAGISNSFGSALWALDYSMEMATHNFAGALFHVGGQSVFYNPFTAAPTAQSRFNDWTVGPIFYSAMIIAEAFGRTENARIAGMTMSSNFTPAYAIYENDVVSKLALTNFMTDESGANDLRVTFAVGGGERGQPNASPASVRVKYLRAPSVGSRDNITWAGQTFGGQFQGDGILRGELQVETIQCNGDNTCTVTVPAPGFALVFITEESWTNSNQETPFEPFATTALTATINTATVDPAVLETSNGGSGKSRQLGGTSPGSNGAMSLVPGVALAISFVAGASLLASAFRP